MVFEIALAVGVLAAGVIIATMSRKPTEGAGMGPDGLDSFRPTQAQEGAVVPLVFGRCRINSNLLWYGNLCTVEEVQSAGGKGFGGDGDAVAGYHYYLDLWHALCLGPGVTLVSAYIQNKPVECDALGAYELNDGGGTSYPAEAGPYANAMPGVAHVFLPQYYLGLNVTTVPTIHFVVERLSAAPFAHANLPNGVNPAAIIYELLVAAGATTDCMDLPSFEAASAYWAGKGYGLNLVFSSQEEVRNHIQRVFTYVDGCLRIDAEDKFVLKAFTGTEAAAAWMVTEDFADFELSRRSWDDTYSDFRANFTDEAQEYTKRTIRVRNPAVRALIGYDRQRTIDLEAFRDQESAAKRLWELMKQLSYPEAQIKCTVGIKFAGLNPGDVVKITHEDHGITNADFRVVTKDLKEADSNDVAFVLVQVLEGLFDDNYAAGGAPRWVTPTSSPRPLAHARILELPYNAITGRDRTFLSLAARQCEETSLVVMVSRSGTDYASHAELSTFAQHGTLDEEYPASTLSIDDTRGIRFTPTRDDPEFGSVSRGELFCTMRVAVVGNELLGFQTVTPEGSAGFRLTGVIRGLLNTPVETHVAGSELWLTTIGKNLITDVAANDFFVKLLPRFGSEVLDPGSAAAIHVTGASLALVPWPPSRVKVTRAGSALSVKVWPTTQDFEGAGVRDGAVQADQDPPALDHDLQWRTSFDATVRTETGAEWTLTHAGAFDLSVRAMRNGSASAWQVVTVGAADGTYIGPEA